MLLDAAEGTFADRANVWVHLALRDAENTERHGQRTTDRDRHAHLIPAASADTRVVASSPRHLGSHSPVTDDRRRIVAFRPGASTTPFGQTMSTAFRSS